MYDTNGVSSGQIDRWMEREKMSCMYDIYRVSVVIENLEMGRQLQAV